MYIQNLTDCSAATYVSKDAEWLRANETAVDEDIRTIAMSP
jgi:hypothetical protein